MTLISNASIAILVGKIKQVWQHISGIVKGVRFVR